MAKKDGKKFSLKQLLAAFAANWSAEGFISRRHEEQRFDAGQAALKRFYQQDKKRRRRPLYIEKEFTFTEGKIQVKGRWDLVEESRVASHGSRAVIVDFKSTEVKDQKKADERAKKSRQLAIYALAWQRRYSALPSALELSAQASDKDLTAVWQDIKKVADGIRAGDYRATPGYRSCGYCPYNEVCPSSAV
jgi:DNA helicase-2/ATP-dependent DNA helicase PcrA